MKIKKFLSVFLVLTMLIASSMMPVFADDTADTLIPFAAYSDFADNGNPVKNIINGSWGDHYRPAGSFNKDSVKGAEGNWTFVVDYAVPNNYTKIHVKWSSSIVTAAALYGSNDGKTWTEIADLTFDTQESTKTFSHSGAYRYVKVETYKMDTTSPAIFEIEFFGNSATKLNPTVIQYSSNVSEGYDYTKITDGDPETCYSVNAWLAGDDGTGNKKQGYPGPWTTTANHIILDLGDIYDVDCLNIIWGAQGYWGKTAPDAYNVYVSADNENYTLVKSYENLFSILKGGENTYNDENTLLKIAYPNWGSIDTEAEMGVYAYGSVIETDLIWEQVRYIKIEITSATVNPTIAEVEVYKIDESSKDRVDYTVKYVDANGNTLLADKTVSNRYVGSSVVETAPEIDEYIARETTITTKLIDGKNEIVFVYDKDTRIYYTIKHLDESGNKIADDTKVYEVNVGDAVVVEAPNLISNKYILAETKLSKNLTIKATNNVVTFVYKKVLIPKNITISVTAGVSTSGENRINMVDGIFTNSTQYAPLSAKGYDPANGPISYVFKFTEIQRFDKMTVYPAYYRATSIKIYVSMDGENWGNPVYVDKFVADTDVETKFYNADGTVATTTYKNEADLGGVYGMYVKYEIVDSATREDGLYKDWKHIREVTFEGEVPEGAYVLGGSIRFADAEKNQVAGLRFGARIIKQDVGIVGEYKYSDDADVKFGFFMLPKNLLSNGQTLTQYLENGVQSALDVPARKIYSQNGKYIDFTAVLTRIPESDYETEVVAVPYVLKDDEYTYFEEITRSFKGVAKAARTSTYSDSNIRTLPISQKIAYNKIASTLDAILDNETTDLRVMSYNILHPEWGNVAITGRDQKVANTITTYLPDVIGVQEASKEWHEALNTLIAKNGDYLPSSCRFGDGTYNMTAFYYNSKTTKLVEEYVLQLHDTKSDIRVLTVGIFEKMGKMFIVLNTHPDTPGNTNNTYKTDISKIIELTSQLMQEYEDVPMLMVGDYNSPKNLSFLYTGYNDIIKNLGVKDSRDVADTVINGYITMPGLNTAPSKYTSGMSQKIVDYIFVNDVVDVNAFDVVYDNNTTAASDHLPIYADITLGAIEVEEQDFTIEIDGVKYYDVIAAGATSDMTDHSALFVDDAEGYYLGDMLFKVNKETFFKILEKPVAGIGSIKWIGYNAGLNFSSNPDKFDGVLPVSKMDDPLYVYMCRPSDYLSDMNRANAFNMGVEADDYEYLIPIAAIHTITDKPIPNDAEFTICIGRMTLSVYTEKDGWVLVEDLPVPSKPNHIYYMPWELEHTLGSMTLPDSRVKLVDDHYEVSLTGAHLNGADAVAYGATGSTLHFWGSMYEIPEKYTIKGVAVSYECWIKEEKWADYLLATVGADWKTPPGTSGGIQVFSGHTYAIGTEKMIAFGHNVGPIAYDEIMDTEKVQGFMGLK